MRAMEIAVLSFADHKIQCGQRLRKLIDLLDLPYVEAAELMGISKHVLRNWMAGESYPQPHSLYRLCRAKGVDFNYVFLDDWSALPHRLSSALEAELKAQLEGSAVQARSDAEHT
jgi:transcriptional regulator with XRE-family HTH domain